MTPRSARVLRGPVSTRRSATTTLCAGLFLALLTAAITVSAEDDPDVAPRDIVLEPAIVRALRIDIDPAAASSSVETLDAVELAARGSHTLGEALDGLAGLRVRRYGPLGALQSVSVRGSSGGHTTVIADGVRLDSMQGSLSDVSLWRADDLRSVEVAKGGHSAQYGTGAGAGVILLEGLPVDALPPVKLTMQAGAFGLRSADVGFTVPTASGGVRLSIGRREATNDFPYVWHGKDRRRTNADVVQDHARLRWDLPISLGEWTLTAVAMRRETGAPGVDTGAPPRAEDDHARQWDDEQILGLRGRVHAGAWRIEPTLNARRSKERYLDPPLDVDSVHRPNMQHAGIVGSREFGASHVAAGLDGERQAITSTDVLDTDRLRGGAFVMGLHRIELPEAISADTAQLDITARADSYSDFGSVVSPRAGFVLRRASARVFANVGESFRAPTLNDLYWTPGGNPDLEPERGAHRAVGVGWSDGSVSAEASRFHTRFRNEIQWAPLANGSWSPLNVTRSRKSGWDGRVSVRQGPWRAALRGSRTIAVDVSDTPETNSTYDKQLRLIPKHMASAEVMYTAAAWGSRAQHRWVGSSFTRADNKDSLPAYSVVDIGVWRRFRVTGMEYEARIDVTNALDGAYVIIPQYPMPGRAFSVTVGASL
ncbi:TonB-dependent receptor [Candidatus Poribacteria bacterium]|jgi:vitamin B12 transporter|nr:TonB-dependent receptor [Candidatus Poribacteria bacterium]MBT5531607.1 TonB-dependent receptor [Candidatus Poribacteria bacterium]MBT5714412.1 TonB-dependent receptor [Candidatus Poribacteria bacterium]MBT7097043.1 TonB-dependent receptor [Candidatus Poribacteria bacterium]MBT7803992.1 TonB-dependent receptor [Candidatus Poribacteria bacterium]